MKRVIFLLAAVAAIAMGTIDMQAQKKVKGSVEKATVAESCERMPIIGVSASETDAASAPITYVRAIKRAGGVPVVIPITTDKAQIEAVLEVVDAVVMTGGEDIDPLKGYGEEPLRALGEIVPERDEFDIMLIRMAVAKGLPVLGICRGEQLMNVAFGGALYQDSPSQ